MGVRLVPLAGGVPIHLRHTINVIGRADDCDVPLKHSTRVSRHHCCIAYVDDRVVIRDLGSTNGVRINGRPILQAEDLHAGDVVSIADLEFRVEPSRPAGGKSARAAARPNGAIRRNQDGRPAAKNHKSNGSPKESGAIRRERRVVRFDFEVDLISEGNAKSEQVAKPRSSSFASHESQDGALAPTGPATPSDGFPAASIAVFSPTQEVPIDPSLITPVDSDDTLYPRYESDDVGSDEGCLTMS